MTGITNAKIFTGNANAKLANKIVRQLKEPLGKIEVGKFSDSEIQVDIQEHIRDETVFIVQSTHSPTNDNLMELLLIVDAAKRSTAKKIVAIIPYYGYSRQDRRPENTRAPISSRLVANLLEVAGVDQVITMDIHSGQQQGFFNVPVLNLSAAPIICGDIWRKYGQSDFIIVSPDTGGVVRARAVAKQLDDADLAIIDKRRPAANQSQVMNVIGDVDGKICIIIDDMIDTAGTLCKAAQALTDRGATSVIAYATHAVLSGDAYDNILNSQLDAVVITDTIPIDTTKSHDKIEVLSVSHIIAEAIDRYHNGKSISGMYWS